MLGYVMKHTNMLYSMLGYVIQHTNMFYVRLCDAAYIHRSLFLDNSHDNQNYGGKQQQPIKYDILQL